MPDPPTPRVAVGDVLAGKYRVERIIGEGGMGVVVAATHLQLDTLVALKFITQGGEHAVARFLSEARSCVRLKSEHVARVSDVGTLDSGKPYMVMEYLEGRDLNSVVESQGPLPVADAVGYVVHALEAVAEAHALGIVHRDLKPHNLFLTTGVGGHPKVKVLDFGISKTLGSELSLTRTAEIVGTPTYMAPEQLRSAKDIDTRADIWALGAILYELLTGRLPFEAESLPQLCTMVVSDPPPPPTTHRADLPPALEHAVLRCLSRAREDRYANVGELAAALAPFAPDWASTRAVLDVGASRPSGSARVVVPSVRTGSDASSAAWSETELAVTTKPRSTARVISIASVALACGVACAWYLEASRGALRATAAATTSPVGSAAPAAKPPQPVTPPPRAEPLAPTALPAASAPPVAGVTPVASATPPAASSHGAPPVSHPRKVTPSASVAPPPPDDPFTSRR